MSQENVEIVRRSWEALRRDGLEAALEVLAPDAEVDLTTGGRVDGGVHRGHDEIRRAYETWASPWESMVMEATEFLDASDDQVVVRFEARGHSIQTGLDLKLERYWVYTMREARAVRVREFETLDKALEAVGLSK